MLKGLLVLVSLMLLALPIPAVAVPCQNAGDVALLGGGCDSGVFHFDSFLVAVSGQEGVAATVFLTDVVDTTLGFTVVTDPPIFSGALNVAFSYHVTDVTVAPIPGDEVPPIAATPEPGTLLLLGSSMAGLGILWRRRRSA